MKSPRAHSRGRNFNQGRGWNPTPRVRVLYPVWTGSWWVLFLPPLSGLFLGPAWSCEMEVSHMGKKPISYRQRWEKILVLFCSVLLCFFCLFCSFISNPRKCTLWVSSWSISQNAIQMNTTTENFHREILQGTWVYTMFPWRNTAARQC